MSYPFAGNFKLECRIMADLQIRQFDLNFQIFEDSKTCFLNSSNNPDLNLEPLPHKSTGGLPMPS